MNRDLNDVSTKFQLDWPANNRIIAGSLFSHFSWSWFSNLSECWEIQVWVAKATKFELDWPANNRIIVGSLFSHFSGFLFSNFSKSSEIQVWLPRQPIFYI